MIERNGPVAAPDRLLTIDEAAERLHVPVSTLRYWRQVVQGPPALKIGRRVMFAPADLDAWIEQQRDTAA